MPSSLVLTQEPEVKALQAALDATDGTCAARIKYFMAIAMFLCMDISESPTEEQQPTNTCGSWGRTKQLAESKWRTQLAVGYPLLEKLRDRQIEGPQPEPRNDKASH